MMIYSRVELYVKRFVNIIRSGGKLESLGFGILEKYEYISLTFLEK